MRIHKLISILLIIAYLSAGTIATTIFTDEATLIHDSSTGRLDSSSDYSVPDKSVVTASNNFGLDLFKKSFSAMQNTIVSPTSLYLAFAMLYNGASAQTQRQMSEAMSIYVDTQTFNENMKALQQSLLAPRNGTQLMLANSIWIRDSFSNMVKAKFLADNAEYFGAMIGFEDFNSSKTADKINKWVSDNTKELIKSVIDDGIDPMAVMYLINTVYFNAKWQIPFQAASTIKEDFKAPSGTVKVDTMHNTEYYQFTNINGVKAIKLPYADGRSSMVILLPDGDLSDLVNKVDSNYIQNVIDSMNRQYVMLSIPKINVQCTFEPIPQLKQMGMIDVFDWNYSDLSGISDWAKELQLHVNEVIHKTVLKIDEEGTEAAAVTSIGIKANSVFFDEPLEMKIDRPFFLAIVDDEAGVIFAGTIVDPRS